MLDVRYIAEHLDAVRDGLARRGFKDTETLDRLVALTAERKSAIQEVEALQQERNAAAAEMGKVKDKGSAEFQERRQSLRALGDRITALDAAAKEKTAELEGIALGLPNLPHASTPDGLDEGSNVELRVVGDKPEQAFEPKDHVDLGVGLGILDFERATKISGARFVALRGLGARLERGLMQFMLDMHADKHGYTEMWVPALVKDSALRGTGQLPKFAEDLFRIAKDEAWEQEADASGHDLFLIPTAEVPLTNLHAGEILESLPVRYCAYTPCFRSEAGAHGQDTRGMIRQHQFDKVELVQFVHPDEAEAALDGLTAHAEAVLQALGLHYRVVQLCAGDLGFAAQKCFDIEVWLPSQQRYREISSCSWFGEFQARRMKIRHRPAPGTGGKKKPKPQLVHTINGSGLAIGRTLVALLEQYQQADGSVLIPGALRPYLGGREVISAG